MTPFKRPMLACALMPNDVEHTDENIYKAMCQLKYPVLATIKKDGIRAVRLTYNGQESLLSRTLKQIPNRSIRERSLKLPRGFDMELWNPNLPYDHIESIVMSREHEDSDLIQFHVLDWIKDDWLGEDRYISRYGKAIQLSLYKSATKFYADNYILCHNADDLFTFFTQSENAGHEGICFRTPDSPYKQGRSTLREQYLVKLCRYLRMEVTIQGFEEQMENCNAEERNAVGLMDRSSSQANLHGKNTLGALLCIDSKNRAVRVGTGVGLTDRLRKLIWDNQHEYMNRTITIKYKPHGEKDLPRSPIFVGFREEGY